MPSFPCPCRSGKDSWQVIDDKGHFVVRVCEDCRDRKLAKDQSQDLARTPVKDLVNPI